MPRMLHQRCAFFFFVVFDVGVFWLLGKSTHCLVLFEIMTSSGKTWKTAQHPQLLRTPLLFPFCVCVCVGACVFLWSCLERPRIHRLCSKHTSLETQPCPVCPLLTNALGLYVTVCFGESWSFYGYNIPYLSWRWDISMAYILARSLQHLHTTQNRVTAMGFESTP